MSSFAVSAEISRPRVPVGTTISTMTTESGRRIGRRIEAARLARGWDKATLARKASVSPSYVTRLEAGQFPSPSIAKLSAIADALGVRVSDLAEVPAAVPADLVDQIRALVGTDAELLRAILADISSRDPEDRPGALRFVLQALQLVRSTPSRV